MNDSSFVSRGGELHLSNLGQLELLRSMMARGVPLHSMARGFSMFPFIRDGDVLTIAPLNGSAPRPGEVIAFVQPESGKLAIHRVIARNGTGWLMRGDNSTEPDGIVARENLLGIVTRVERGGRDVRLGLGAERALIAALNRGKSLQWLKKLWYLPHRIVTRLLRGAQALPLYRTIGRKLAPGVAIAVADTHDLESVHRHFNPLVPYRAQTLDPNVTNWIARHGSDLVGFVQHVRHPQEHFPWVGHWLFSLEVWGQYRGLGIGERLTQCVIVQAAEENAPELLLAVFDDNQRAIRLYRKLGFEEITHPALEPQFEAEKIKFGRRRIVMRKNLMDNR